MKAMVIEEFGGAEKMHLAEVARPVPQENEVLIKIAYAGVNPVDFKIREGLLQTRTPHEFPIILGWDAAGSIVEIGKQVRVFKMGEEVFAYCRKPLIRWGAYAEYIAVDAKNVARKPTNLSLAQSAALPLVSLTAWQSLFDAANLKQGEVVLILGGSGGVGAMAIQFAKHAGATVIATARAEKQQYIKQLGSDVVIDYHDDVADLVKDKYPSGVDVVFDCVGSKSFEQGLALVKKGGRIVSILEKLDEAQAKERGITAYYVFVSPNGAQLTQIATLIQEHQVTALPIQEMSLAQAAEALEKLRTGDVLGKLVLNCKIV